jgi:hypothetical protein
VRSGFLSGPGRSNLAWVRVAGALLLLSAVLWAARWAHDPQRSPGDTFWYTRYALELSGSNPHDATINAAQYVVQLSGVTDEAAQVRDEQGWIDLASTIDPRYPGIFLERPFYPATAALLVPAIGPSAMVISAAFAGALVGTILGLFVLLLTGSLLGAFSSAILLFALPSGSAIALIYSDGWMLVWWVLALAATSIYLTGGGRRWAGVFCIAVVLLAATKAVNLVPLVVALVGTTAIAVGRREDWPRAAFLSAVAVGVAVSESFVFLVLGLPGITVTLQDLFTAHFTKPDVPDPVALLAARDATYVRGWVASLVGAVSHPFTSLARNEIVLATGIAGLMGPASLWAVPWIIGSGATVIVVLLHPVPTQVVRLLAPLWPSVAIGLALWIARIEARTRRLLIERRGDGRAASPLDQPSV